MTRDGALLLDDDLRLCWDFKRGYARIFGDNGMGVIDSTGQPAVPLRYRDIRDLDRNDLWAFRLF